MKKLLKKDVELTKKFVSALLNFDAVRSFKRQCKFLEWSCHGVVWLVGLIAFTYVVQSQALHEMEVNLFVALIVDMFAVAIIKGEMEKIRE